MQLDWSIKQVRRQSCQLCQGAQFSDPKSAALGAECEPEICLPTSSQHPLPPILNHTVFVPNTTNCVNVKLLSYPLMVCSYFISCSDMCSGLFIRLDHAVELEKTCMCSGLKHSTALDNLVQSNLSKITWEVCCRVGNQVQT